MLILEDQHEHLGQSIAYARTNGVVPPGLSRSAARSYHRARPNWPGSSPH